MNDDPKAFAARIWQQGGERGNPETLPDTGRAVAFLEWLQPRSIWRLEAYARGPGTGRSFEMWPGPTRAVRAKEWIRRTQQEHGRSINFRCDAACVHLLDDCPARLRLIGVKTPPPDAAFNDGRNPLFFWRDPSDALRRELDRLFGADYEDPTFGCAPPLPWTIVFWGEDGSGDTYVAPWGRT